MLVLDRVKSTARPLLMWAYWKWRNTRDNLQIESWNVGRGASLGRRVIIRKGNEIGNDVQVGDYSYISGPRTYIESAEIGKFCSIARQTIIGVGNHDHTLVTTHPFIIAPEFGQLRAARRPSVQKPRPVIGNDVWIGVNCIVMRGVTIGDGAVVAANSVVTRDVAPYSIVGGAPARHLRARFPDETAQALSRIKWWDWTEAELKDRVDRFEDVNAFVAAFGAERDSDHGRSHS